MKKSLASAAFAAALVLVGSLVVWPRSWDLGYVLCVAGVMILLGLATSAFREARTEGIAAIPVPAEGYLPQLDGLRFLAFMLVFTHHVIPFDDHPVALAIHENGWMGVDLFFVVSSFLFFVLLFREHDTSGRIHIGHFFIRRTLRIWPLYFAYLLLMMALDGPLRDIPGLIVGNERIRGSFLFYDNLLTFWHRSYQHEILYVDHLWTLSFEEQVYLATPFLAWLTVVAYRRGVAVLPALLFLITPIVGIALRRALLHTGIGHPSIWVNPMLRSETVCAGFLVAMLVRSRAYQRIPPVVYPAGIVASFIYLFGNVGEVDLSPHSSLTVYVALAVAFSCVLLSVLTNRFLARCFGLPALAYLGKISFGLYVWHVYAIRWSQKYVLPVLGIFMRGTTWERWWSATILSALAVTVCFAALSYRYFERPFLRLKKRFTHVENRPI